MEGLSLYVGSHCGSVKQTNQPGVCVCVCVYMCLHSSEIGALIYNPRASAGETWGLVIGFSNPQNPSGIDLPGGASEWSWAPPQKTRALYFTYKLSYL